MSELSSSVASKWTCTCLLFLEERCGSANRWHAWHTSLAWDHSVNMALKQPHGSQPKCYFCSSTQAVVLSPAHLSALFEKSMQNDTTDELWIFPVSVAVWYVSSDFPPTLKYTRIQSHYGSKTEQGFFVCVCVVRFVASSGICWVLSFVLSFHVFNHTVIIVDIAKLWIINCL